MARYAPSAHAAGFEVIYYFLNASSLLIPILRLQFIEKR
jgi:hypothetical protein